MTNLDRFTLARYLDLFNIRIPAYPTAKTLIRRLHLIFQHHRDRIHKPLPRRALTTHDRHASVRDHELNIRAEVAFLFLLRGSRDLVSTACALPERSLELVVKEAEVVRRWIDGQGCDIDVCGCRREEDRQGQFESCDAEAGVVVDLGEVAFPQVARVFDSPVGGTGNHCASLSY